MRFERCIISKAGQGSYLAGADYFGTTESQCTQESKELACRTLKADKECIFAFIEEAVHGGDNGCRIAIACRLTDMCSKCLEDAFKPHVCRRYNIPSERIGDLSGKVGMMSTKSKR